MADCIVVLDFGSQYSQLIVRRIRELNVFCEYFSWDAKAQDVLALQPRGFILSGGPNSIYDQDAPALPGYVLEGGVPILGICYGMHALAASLAGKVEAHAMREYGQANIEVIKSSPLLPDMPQSVWMSHGDQVTKLPANFSVLAQSDNCPVAAIGDVGQKRYGLQFHPEVNHTQYGRQILSNFVKEICGCKAEWTPDSIIEQAVRRIREQVGKQPILATISGGVDSSVATMLVQKAVGRNLKAIFVDTGMLRLGEADQVRQTFQPILGENLVMVDAREQFLNKLKDVTDPEEKRKIIGAEFIRTFERVSAGMGTIPFLIQGTIYPDVIESRASERNHAQRIKSHHNVAGLPEDMQFKMVEPLRYLFKDEVRRIGSALGLSPEIVWRQPFPGPGLAVRCLGNITQARLDVLRQCDAIFTSELSAVGLMTWDATDPDDLGTSQAFAVLLPVKSVGVMGDQRTYQEVVALRAVTSEDFMTADWQRLPYELLARVSTRIINEVAGVNRVVYDITSKPPGTIEWE